MAVTADNLLKSQQPWYRQGELLLSAGLLASLGVMLIPLPTVLLDMLLALNLAQSTLLLLITLNARHPLELSVFPSLLLLLTLFRLTLNVATTRLILLDGDAGRIVSTFGSLVVGGNLVVGLVIFLILVVIQFVVITKGSGRISEVAARFTLDALPGKQMAIDAEMNAGGITNEVARQRRENLARETEFYGAMDGAGKFVRGDAIAGLLITGVNLIGGVVIGLTDGLGFLQSLKTYSILTVGDGLVSQIPALIIATTAGILVTKASSDQDLGAEIGDQLLRNERPLWIGAAMLGVLALMPGLPKIPFLALSGGLLLYLNRRRTAPATAATPQTPPPPEDEGDKKQL
ncbi:MAG: flagellar biosynthesis protein FlhA, partial [Planctomycetaceae bacterium]